MSKIHSLFVRAVFPVVAGLVLLALPVAQAKALPLVNGQPTSIGQAIIGFAPGARPAVQPGELLVGLPVAQVSTNGNFIVVGARDLAIVREAVQGMPGVSYVEDNGIVHALATPSDARYGEQYGPGMMGFPAAWGQAGYGSSSVVVAVVDSGIRSTHQDFVGGRVRSGWDYVQNDGVPQDTCGHGTHTAGTVGATTNNGVGVAGMSQATILPMKALAAVGGLLNVQCTGNVAQISQAIMDSADQGAKVISMSIGGGASATEENAVNYAANKGVILVAAAGNDGASNSVDYPAAYPNVIAVAALTSAKVRASYSDSGPQVDVAAPGSGVLSTYNSNDTSYTLLDGTSMATPHVAGALALALSCAPGISAAALTSALYSTAEDLGTAGRDDIYGNGLARADLLVSQVCSGAPGNLPPTAAFTSSVSGRTVNVNGTGSSDPNGDSLTYAWTFGDGGTGSGATTSHLYAADGTYTVTLTVNDGHGGSNSKSSSVVIGTGGDPDPLTPTITSGANNSVTLSGVGTDKFYKIAVPSGAAQLQVVMTGPACGALGLNCSVDFDLYTNPAARPTDTVYACRPFANGNAETCTHPSPSSSNGYWYIRVKSAKGSGTVNVKATVS